MANVSVLYEDFPGESVGWISKCNLCGLDSGPWHKRRKASWSSLTHLKSHHPETFRKRWSLSR